MQETKLTIYIFHSGGYFNTCDVCGVDMGVTQSKFMLTCHCWSDDGVFEETSVDLSKISPLHNSEVSGICQGTVDGTRTMKTDIVSA